MKSKKILRLGDLLVNVGKISEAQLNFALEIQKQKKQKLGQVLTELEYIDNKDIIEVLEFQLGIPQVDLEKYYIDADVPHLITEEFARKNLLIPIKRDGTKLSVAMYDPLNIIIINDIEIITGFQVEVKIATEHDIKNAIDRYYSKKSVELAVEEFTKGFEFIEDEHLDQDLLREINNAPVVRLVNTIITQAAQSKASDIHIEPEAEYLRIRFRVDGDLQEAMRPAKQTHGAIITRIKIMAKMDIAERRIPQDGRIELELKGRELDLRVSSIPSIYGEKIVIRMLDRSTFLKTKEDLGLTDYNLEVYNNIMHSHNGVILVTGPTGSGKSTTMYSMLNELNDIKKNILTIEDPVEYRLEGIIQSQVNPKAGYDFPTGLRSMLRQDPDVIMVGEIRDQETAEMAIRAAITGHLVLSTLHTNSAIATVNRLLDMGIEPYLVASSLVAIVAQLLVKKVCPSCKLPYIPDDKDRIIMGSTDIGDIEVFKGTGCPMCKGTGYRGRIPVFEILQLDSVSRAMIVSGVNTEEVKRYLRSTGMKSIVDNCKELVRSGETTIDELLRISYSVEG